MCIVPKSAWHTAVVLHTCCSAKRTLPIAAVPLGRFQLLEKNGGGARARHARGRERQAMWVGKLQQQIMGAPYPEGVRRTAVVVRVAVLIVPVQVVIGPVVEWAWVGHLRAELAGGMGIRGHRLTEEIIEPKNRLFYKYFCSLQTDWRERCCPEAVKRAQGVFNVQSHPAVKSVTTAALAGQ